MATTSSRATASCASSILACGCTITTHGSYAISPSGATLASSGPFCVKIASSNVLLDLSNSKITGPGPNTATVGVQVLPATPAGLPIKKVSIVSSGGQSELDDFGIGLSSGAAVTRVMEVNANFNGKGMVFNGLAPVVISASLTGNNNTGIKINQGASEAVLITIGALLNITGPGVWINGAGGVFMNGVGADENGTYGVWLDGAPGNTLESFSATGNGIAGVYLGCAPSGPNGTTCTTLSRLPSSFNNIFGNVVGPTPASVNGSGFQSYGVAIGKGNGNNHVVLIDGTGNKTDDGFDENLGCGSNTWVRNGLTVRNQTVSPFCIGNGP